MQTLVHLVAPHSPGGWALRILILMVAIIGIGGVFEDLLSPAGTFDLRSHVLVSLAVALPFVVLGLALIAHLDRMQRRLAHLAATDLLTGLPNRRDFFDRAGREVGADQLVLMLDIDHFKRINDTYGHAVGDLCLVQVADALRRSVAPDGLLARMGGEEFAALIGCVPRGRAADLAAGLAAGTRIDLASPPLSMQVTLSVGGSRWRRGEGLETALSRADEALYKAKGSGRARVVLASGQDDPTPTVRAAAQAGRGRVSGGQGLA